MKRGIFVSHVSEEAALAEALKDLLNGEFPDKLDIFVSSDRKSIRAGTEWLRELKAALSGAPIVIVMCSQESVGQPWVNFEAGGGWIRETPVVPVCHSGMSPSDLPVPLVMLNGIEANDLDGLQKLCDVIAEELGEESPESDRTGFVREFGKLEEEYLKSQDAARRIANPTVLCAATEQFGEPSYGFDQDVEVLTRHFGDAVDVMRDLTSNRLREALAEKQYNIVHLVMHVHEDSGELVFDQVAPGGHPVTRNPDMLTSSAFADLLERSGNINLVFLATCRALFLGVDVARVTNMIATHVEVTGDLVERWSDCFYGYLQRGTPLYEATDATVNQISGVPLRLIPHKDFAFAPSHQQ